MKYIQEYKRAGEPTESAPYYLCKEAYQSLAIWRFKSLEDMHRRINQEIQDIDRIEYRAIDEDGTIKAMMILQVWENEPHTGFDTLITRFSFSSVNGLLTNGYRFMIKCAKTLKLNMICFSRHEGPLKISHVFKYLK
ncbi:hypothetical protein VAA96_004539 [Salmonella enterica]|nr:hypothetical protein [Salmonella enterica]